MAYWVKYQDSVYDMHLWDGQRVEYKIKRYSGPFKKVVSQFKNRRGWPAAVVSMNSVLTCCAVGCDPS
jgi:hypothetical protein